jgi:hypothetical protein
MSFPVFSQARDSINKAYVALQNWNANPADTPLPDVVDTKRSHLTHQQIAARYLKSVDGNPDIDINKLPIAAAVAIVGIMALAAHGAVNYCRATPAEGQPQTSA